MRAEGMPERGAGRRSDAAAADGQAAGIGSFDPALLDTDTKRRDDAALADLLSDSCLRIGKEAMRRLVVKEWPAEAPPPDRRRDQVREGTKRKVAEELGLRQFGDPAVNARKVPPWSEFVTLYRDVTPNASATRRAPAGGRNLLARFDVLAVPGRADFDAAWTSLHRQPSRKPFFVLHAAALNVGESAETAADFEDYATPSHELDDRRYVRDMGQIFENILYVAKDIKVKHLIWFPFGMGAFLRHLERKDRRYAGNPGANTASLALRRALCQQFVEALQRAAASNPGFQIHLCLAPSGEGTEADANVDSFVRALQERPLPAGFLTVCLQADALQVAHEIAGTLGEDVAVVNGANRELVGNHWFAGGARHAIDENLHRRSWCLGAHAYMLNDFGTSRSATLTADTLSQRVAALGGRVKTIIRK